MAEIDMSIGARRTMPGGVGSCGSVLGVIRHGGYPVLCCRLMPVSEELLLAVDGNFSGLFPLDSCGRKGLRRGGWV